MVNKDSMPLTEYAVIDTDKNVVDFKGVHRSKCLHMRIELDSKEAEVTCIDCKVKINPINWMLDNAKFFAIQFRKLEEIREKIINEREEVKQKIEEDQAELEKRARTRCQHCRKMTAINLKHHKFVVL